MGFESEELHEPEGRGTDGSGGAIAAHRGHHAVLDEIAVGASDDALGEAGARTRSSRLHHIGPNHQVIAIGGGRPPAAGGASGSRGSPETTRLHYGTAPPVHHSRAT